MLPALDPMGDRVLRGFVVGDQINCVLFSKSKLQVPQTEGVLSELEVLP